ncbi:MULTISPECIES: GPO family capsid scaffolding protein [unclassified Symbiopectobacterium]|uniref:GPO family capsid scaffolding protein n=1 Tax=unclassified Symbiopectobacterium TaxID=2794573 RepID=UPI002225BFF4|nr:MULTISPECIES: GPO family capsid scaffolding protein [unclassified Symbiopectobacterium]MCW2474678.1 GPO family capsid scaffolding protein [Candidatus Symbiopectobacterium sp. NZEC151]MCW2482419.1 GPO family capsid scaffolding protein [Candidatus Symbiopectobacterium sp. NZEC135]
MSQLMTNWICIATEGETVDKRQMDRQWLIEAAELYDPQLYTALIWPEHEKWFGNMGEVLAAKAEQGDDGLMRLYAQLRPNNYLLQANRDGQMIFCSVELTPDGNFRGTGKHYLEGLGVTDTPASVGTTRLNFHKRKNRNRLLGAFKPLVIDEVKAFKEKGMAKESTKPTWHSLFGIKPKNFAEEEGSEGNDDKLQALAEALTALETRVAALETGQEEVQEDLEVVKDVVDTQEFAKLRDALPEIIKNFGKLDAKITKLPQRKIGDKEKRFNHLV